MSRDPFRCCWPGCRAEPEVEDGVPVCLSHYQLIGVRFMARRSILSPDFNREGRERRKAEYDAQWAEIRRAREAASVVYYVRLGDHVKIGTSQHLPSRLTALQVAHLPDALLATEPGGRDVESARHRQFAAERIHPQRELFNPSPRLLAHIEALKLAAA